MRIRSAWRAALAAGAALVMLSACAGAGGSADTSGGGKTLEIWHAYAGQKDKVEFIEYALDTFKKAHPDIKVKEVSAEQSSYKTKLQTAMASGNAPDVFYTLPGGYLKAFVDSGQVLRLDDELAKQGWRDSFLESSLPSVTFGGSTYAVPIDIDAALVWYNKALFDAKGWQVPTTWPEFLDLAEKIKSAGVVPVALGNKDSWPATFWFQYAEMRMHGSGVMSGFGAGDKNATFGPEAKDAAGVLQTLAQKGYLPKGANGMSDAEANILFLNGKAAMVLNGTWQIGMSAEAPAGFELGYFPFPTFAAGKGNQSDVLAGVAASFAVSEKAKDKEAALAFLRHITSPEVMTKYVQIRKTMVARKGATTPEAAGPLLAGVVQDVIGKAETLDPFYDTAMAPKTTETYYSTLQGLIDGSIPPAAASDAIENAAKAGK
ncbi:ABC transporter substrate-binding protein [Micromonospora sp. NPDC007230]|uniref:ABC transporter substrate-binding protein n=1 Tax=Micromonospora sp. NPDC007230 TaxID=3364237 RepID=UPI00369E077D